jgi:hypothetical protein
VPPTIIAPATIPTFLITFLLKNSPLSGGVSVGSVEWEGVDPSDVGWCNGANPSGMGLCKRPEPPDIESSEGIDSDVAWCNGANPSGIGLCKDSDPPNTDSSEGIDSDAEWCDGANPSSIGLCKDTNPTDIGSNEGVSPCGGELVSVGGRSDHVSCRDGGITNDPELEG